MVTTFRPNPREDILDSGTEDFLTQSAGLSCPADPPSGSPNVRGRVTLEFLTLTRQVLNVSAAQLLHLQNGNNAYLAMSGDARDSVPDGSPERFLYRQNQKSSSAFGRRPPYPARPQVRRYPALGTPGRPASPDPGGRRTRQGNKLARPVRRRALTADWWSWPWAPRRRGRLPRSAALLGASSASSSQKRSPSNGRDAPAPPRDA
ncbi:hypothetical protein H8959_010073 [Pygathrix nigripes]